MSNTVGPYAPPALRSPPAEQDSAAASSFTTGTKGTPVKIGGRKAVALPVKLTLNTGNGPLNDTSWGGGKRAVAAYRFAPADIPAARQDTNFKSFLVNAAATPVLGSNVERAIAGKDGFFDDKETKMIPLKPTKESLEKAFRKWMDDDQVPPERINLLMKPISKEIIPALIRDKNAQFYKIETSLPGLDQRGVEHYLSALLSVNRQTGQVNTLSGHYSMQAPPKQVGVESFGG